MQFQLELPIKRAPKGDPEKLAMLLSALRGRNWCKAAYIEREIGISERIVRALANQSEGQIISGQRGYKLTSEATIEEIRHAATWLRHQAKEMERRAMQIDRVYHRREQAIQR